MRLRTVKFEGVRGLPSNSWDFAPLGDSQNDLVVVTGASGSGKTTFLEAIVAAKEGVAPYGTPDPRWAWLVPKEARAAKANLVWQVSPAELERYKLPEPHFDTESIFGEPAASVPVIPNAIKKILGTWSPDGAQGRLAYFHQGRALPHALPNETAKSDGGYSSLSSDRKFSFLHAVFDDARMPTRALARELFRSLVPKLDFAGRTPYRNSLEPWFSNATEARVIPHAMLSASEKQALLFAFTFAHAQIHDSVVLIDAPEEGFGDVAAVSLVRALLGWGRGNQLIVATSSPQVAAMAPPGRVITLGL